MRTVRRLYFYLVAFITFEVVLWIGVINLLRSTFSPEIGGSGDMLAGALSVLLVGIPIFALHWLWAQRVSAADEEEHAASLRAIFLYGILLGTLIPLIQNVLALLDRSLLSAAGLNSYLAVFGGLQTWTDNLIAILINALAAAYFLRVLRRDWATLSDKENFADVRRLYRFIWLLYSLLMVIFGVEQVVHFLLTIPADLLTLGDPNRDWLMNGLSLLLVGAPLWYFSWKACQDALSQPGDRGSSLRLGVLYLLAFSSMAVVLSTGGYILDSLLSWILGETMKAAEFLGHVSGALSTALPFGVVWAYYGGWLQRDIRSLDDEDHRNELLRFYYYVLSFAGLVTAFVGMALLVSFLIIDRLAGPQIWPDDLRSRLAAALATLAVGLPLWLASWPRMQRQACEGTVAARRSVVRKAYLYLVLFASVIGGMVSAVYVFYRLLQAALGLESLDVTALLDSLQLLVLFAVVLVYHLLRLRADGSDAAQAREAERASFHALVFERGGSGFGEAVTLATRKAAPGLELTVLASDAEIPEEAASARAVILPSDAAVNPPDALRKFLAAFDGQVIVVPVESARLIWLGGTGRKSIEGAALALRQLSEGQEARQAGGTPAWMVVVYIFAVLFGLQLLLMLLSLGISLFVN